MYSYKRKYNKYFITYNNKIIGKGKTKSTVLKQLRKLVHNEFNEMIKDCFTNYNENRIEKINNQIKQLEQKHNLI